jgi:hypothetical protein
MKAIIFSFVIILFLSLLEVGCKGSINPTGYSQEDYNLISNGSFEINAEPSLNGWYPNNSDTSYINYSIDVPPDGGKYSVKLKNDWIIAGTITTYVIPSIGTHQYRFSIWAKVLKWSPNDPIYGGEILILTKSKGTINFEKLYYFSDTTWTHEEIIDTLSSTTVDTVLIKLRGNITQFGRGYTLFDLCRFEKIN